MKLSVVVVGPGHDAVPLQIAVIEKATDPDIAVLLVATSEYTPVAVVVIVFPSLSCRPTRVAVIVTALPEIEPLIELVTIVTPAVGANWRVPEIDVPV